MKDQALERGLPCNLDAERFILGSILLDSEQFELIAGSITAEDFNIEKHRRIFTRMGDLASRGEPIDTVTLYNEPNRHSEAESCDGVSYIASLNDGIPQVPNLDGYVRIVQEKATLRRAIFAAQKLVNRCFEARDGAADILADAEAILSKLADGHPKHGQWLNPGEVMTSYPGGINAFMQPPTGGDGLSTPWTGLTSALCGFHQGDLFLVAGRPGMGKSMKGVGRFESRHHEFSEISHYLKHLAGQFGLTVVLLSQLNRECEKAARRPQLSDLKETGSLEEDADVVLFVHRPEQYNRQDPALRGKAEFIIGKQRNGPTGKRNMVFQHEYQRFVEVTNDEGMNE